MEVPSLLYKYMSASTAKLVLESQKIRWSCPSSFNDINELQRMPIFHPSIEESKADYLKVILSVAYGEQQVEKPLSNNSLLLISLVKILRDKGVDKDDLYNRLALLELNLSSLEESLREQTESYNNGDLRIICLSEDGNNEVMWAHYGGSHTGCMLEFRHLEELDTPFKMAKKVTYIDSTPQLGSALDYLLYNDNKELLASTASAIFYTKREKWKYEKEWRVMTRRPNEGKRFSDFTFYNNELVSVTFAARVSDIDLAELINIIKDQYTECKLYKVRSFKGKHERVKFDG